MEKNKNRLGELIKQLIAVVLISSTMFFASCNSGDQGPEESGQLSIGYNKGYAPEQPIPYDHSLHAGKLKIKCLFCHANAEVSRHATVPSLNICMNCHLTVGSGENIDKLRDAYNNKKPVKWSKVHMLPDFVSFNHKAHVRKNVSCQTCHGPIETMKKVRQHTDLSMGWCVNCHRKPENNAPLDCTTCHL